VQGFFGKGCFSFALFEAQYSKFSKSSGKNEKKVDKQDFNCYKHNA